MIRTIKKMITGRQTTDGAGVRLIRVFAQNEAREFDPFLMLDAFDSQNPADYIKGFPMHPHRGIETVTYLIQGRIEHGDSLGNRGVIQGGECQWMTSGSGILHEEMPQPSGRLFGVQLWLNLPAKDKMTQPAYNGITESDIPAVEAFGARVRIIAGKYEGVQGAFEGHYVRPLFLDVSLDAGASWSLATEPFSTLFVYILQGGGYFGNQNNAVPEKHALLFSQGDTFAVRSEKTGMRFLLLCGKALHEPIAWGGPIVMNTQEELDLAFDELSENIFIKNKL
jgi:redox-sensitive bicupin YhaK (pirin superfamily)